MMTRWTTQLKEPPLSSVASPVRISESAREALEAPGFAAVAFSSSRAAGQDIPLPSEAAPAAKEEPDDGEFDEKTSSLRSVTQRVCEKIKPFSSGGISGKTFIRLSRSSWLPGMR